MTTDDFAQFLIRLEDARALVRRLEGALAVFHESSNGAARLASTSAVNGSDARTVPAGLEAWQASTTDPKRRGKVLYAVVEALGDQATVTTTAATLEALGYTYNGPRLSMGLRWKTITRGRGDRLRVTPKGHAELAKVT